jgi:hypothetical protein
MSASHRDKPAALGCAVENLRRLFEQVLSADDASDPQLFDELSQSAAEIAQLYAGGAASEMRESRRL